MKNLMKIILIGLALICLGCSGEERRFTNLYLKWEGNDTSTLYIKKGAGDWVEYKNPNFCTVMMKRFENSLGEPMYRVTYVGDFEFNFVWFSGYNNYVMNKEGELVRDTTIELPFDYKTSHTFSSTGRLVEEEEYQISLSKVNW